MWLGERYIYDDPLCEDISYCRGEKGNLGAQIDRGFETEDKHIFKKLQ